MRNPIAHGAIALVTFLAGMNGAADATDRPPAAPIVVELFTSQGCSSCPPADALLGELTRRADVLPLAFHVTYWNDLGWQDRFSFREADARQYRYASAMGSRSVYTPQMIVNGSRNVLGSNRKGVQQAIAAATAPAAIRLSVMNGTIQYSLPDVEGGCDCELLLLAVQPSTQTPVGRGENAGRLLHEFNVVRRVAPLPRWDGNAQKRAQAIAPSNEEVSMQVLLAQRRVDGRIVAVGVAP
jgi:hypothetical protein